MSYIRKKYITPSIISQQIKLNQFFRADHWYGDIEQFLIKETYASSHGYTTFLPIIINDPPSGGGGGGGGS